MNRTDDTVRRIKRWGDQRLILNVLWSVRFVYYVDHKRNTSFHWKEVLLSCIIFCSSHLFGGTLCPPKKVVLENDDCVVWVNFQFYLNFHENYSQKFFSKMSIAPMLIFYLKKKKNCPGIYYHQCTAKNREIFRLLSS